MSSDRQSGRGDADNSQTSASPEKPTILAKLTIVDLQAAAAVVSHLLKWAIGKGQAASRAREHRQDLRDLFGVRDVVFLRPGASHPQFQAQVHPDNVVAAGDVYTLLTDDTTEALVFNYIPQSEGNIFLFGSPRSTHEVTPILGLLNDPKWDPRLASLPFDLTYTFGGFDGSLSQARRFIGKSEREMLLGGVYMLGEGEPRLLQCARPAPDGWLASDVAVITVLPNVLDVESYLNGEKIVSIAGASGVGTKIAGPLLGDLEAVKKIRLNAHGSRAFQVLVFIDDIAHENLDSLPAGFEIAAVAPVDVDEERVARWLRLRRDRSTA